MQPFLCSLAFSIALAVSAVGAEGVAFHQQYKVGQSYHQTITMEQEMAVESAAPRMEQRTSTTMGLAVAVRAHEDGHSRRAAMRYDRAVMGMESGGQKFSYDSQNPSAVNAGPLAAFGRVVGQEFRVIFDEADAVKEVENSAAIVTGLAGADVNNAQLFEQLFNKDAVVRMMQQSALRSPGGKTVLLGGSWPFRTEVVMPAIGKLFIEGSYTFKQMTDVGGVACAEVEAKATISIQTTSSERETAKADRLIEQMAMKVEQGTLEGRLMYDPALGFCRSVQMVQNVTLTAKVPDGSGATLRMPMKQTVSMVLDSAGPTPKEE